MTKAEKEACLARAVAYSDAYLGLAEFAQVLGLSKQACSNQRARGKLPTPHQELAMSPIWTRDQVLVYVERFADFPEK